MTTIQMSVQSFFFLLSSAVNAANPDFMTHSTHWKFYSDFDPIGDK